MSSCQPVNNRCFFVHEIMGRLFVLDIFVEGYPKLPPKNKTKESNDGSLVDRCPN